MAQDPVIPTTSRRDFLASVAVGSAAALAGPGVLTGCGKRGRRSGLASNAAAVAAVLPSYRPITLIPPDEPGDGPLPDGYHRYPTSLVQTIQRKPGRGGRPIKSISVTWGPTPPGLGRNTFIDAVNRELGVQLDPSVQDGPTFAPKLSAILGARDVPELLSTPSWEVERIPRFTQAAKALFADLTEYLKGDAVHAYPMLATLPTSSWQDCVWGGRLAAVPYPTDGPFPWALFYRKDLTDLAGVEAPTSIDALHAFGKKMTDPGRGVWAFGDVWEMVQMFFKCPGQKGGWRKKPSGGLEFKYEMPEYRYALEFTVRLHKEGLVHPDIIANAGSDAKQLFNAGKIISYRDGVGAWRGAQSEQAKITPGYNIQPVPVFSAVGGEPLSWASEAPIFYTFVKKGLGRERTEEILRVLDWCAAPFGSRERELAQFGVEGKHFTRAPDGSPALTSLGRTEIADQYVLLGGRVPALVGTADVPSFVHDLLAYSRTTLRYREPDLFKGIKVEFPSGYSRVMTATEDKINDIVRGRRPLADLSQIVKEWRNAGGDEGRAFFEKVLADNGR